MQLRTLVMLSLMSQHFGRTLHERLPPGLPRLSGALSNTLTPLKLFCLAVLLGVGKLQPLSNDLCNCHLCIMEGMVMKLPVLIF